MATATPPPKWYRVSVTDLDESNKDKLIENGWIEHTLNKGLFKKGTGTKGTTNLTSDNAMNLPAAVATKASIDELNELFAGMNVKGGRRKSKKTRKSKKARKSRKGKSRKSKSHKK